MSLQGTASVLVRFSRETETRGCVHIEKEIEIKGSASSTVEADKSRDRPGELASWRPVTAESGGREKPMSQLQAARQEGFSLLRAGSAVLFIQAFN